MGGLRLDAPVVESNLKDTYSKSYPYATELRRESSEPVVTSGVHKMPHENSTPVGLGGIFGPPPTAPTVPSGTTKVGFSDNIFNQSDYHSESAYSTHRHSDSALQAYTVAPYRSWDDIRREQETGERCKFRTWDQIRQSAPADVQV